MCRYIFKHFKCNATNVQENVNFYYTVVPVFVGHTRWEEVEGRMVEKLVLLTEVEGGKSSVPKKPHGVGKGVEPFNYATGGRDERTSLLTLGSPKCGTPKSPEEDLGDELTKLLEGKDDESPFASLNGDSEDANVELDFEDDDLGDIAVNESKSQSLDSNPRRSHP